MLSSYCSDLPFHIKKKISYIIHKQEVTLSYYEILHCGLIEVSSKSYSSDAYMTYFALLVCIQQDAKNSMRVGIQRSILRHFYRWLKSELRKEIKVVVIGKCGLDYDRLHFCPSKIQNKYFEKQFELAYATKLPMFLHMRAAAEDFRDILGQNRDR